MKIEEHIEYAVCCTEYEADFGEVQHGGDVAETSAAGSGSRECQTTTDALCLPCKSYLYFVCCTVHTIIHSCTT